MRRTNFPIVVRRKILVFPQNTEPRRLTPEELAVVRADTEYLLDDGCKKYVSAVFVRLKSQTGRANYNTTDVMELYRAVESGLLGNRNTRFLATLEYILIPFLSAKTSASGLMTRRSIQPAEIRMLRFMGRISLGLIRLDFCRTQKILYLLLTLTRTSSCTLKMAIRDAR